jgi:hypothetical protein
MTALKGIATAGPAERTELAFVVIDGVQLPERRDGQRFFFGGGYTYLAIVADVHPTTHPGNITFSLSTVSLLAILGTIIQIRAHTIAHPIAYPV